MKRIVFLDRDGVLNYDSGYTYQTGEYRLLPGVKEALKSLKKNGFDLIIISNQSGIGRGLYSEDDYADFTKLLAEDLKKDGIEILGHYFCPHHPELGKGKYKIDCDCRKPKPGLVLRAEKEKGPFEYANSWVIGNAERDAAMGKNAHSAIRTILVPENYGTSDEKQIEQSEYADYLASSLLEAVDIILKIRLTSA